MNDKVIRMAVSLILPPPVATACLLAFIALLGENIRSSDLPVLLFLYLAYGYLLWLIPGLLFWLALESVVKHTDLLKSGRVKYTLMGASLGIIAGIMVLIMMKVFGDKGGGELIVWLMFAMTGFISCGLTSMVIYSKPMKNPN